MKRAGISAAIVVICAGCGGGSSSGGGPQPSGDVSTATTLTQAQLGKDWPLKNAESAIVACVDSFGPGSGSIIVTINGTAYGLNGTARQSGKWPDFNTSGYWRNDPILGYGLKVSVDPLIEAGLKDCHGGG